MPKYQTTDIRNIALVGHGGAGKTSLIEALLHAAGAIGEVGSVENHNTVSDYTDEEKHRQQSLFNTAMSLDYQGKHINIIDTPGASDFSNQGLAALTAVETAVIVINATTGIEPTTRRMMERAKEANLCRMIVINRIDAENIDLETLVSQIQETFGSECLPVNLPAKGATAVSDCFFHVEGESDFSSVDEAHTAIIEQVVEVDEEVAMAYLEGEEISKEQLHEVFERALREGHLVPICFTAARRHDDHNKSTGVTELLEFLVKLAPNPTEGNPRPFLKGSGEEAEDMFPEPDADKEVLAHAFKIAIDRFGKLSIFRVHQGTITKDTPLYIGEGKKPIKPAHIYKVHGGEHHEVDALIPGDIGALIKVDEISFYSVLHSQSHDEDIRFNGIRMPEPMFGQAVTAKSRGDEAKIGDALHKLDDEDPTFKVSRDSVTHETVIYGSGEMHVRVMIERLKSKYGVEVETSPPKIAYRETIQGKGEGHYRHKKQTGGAGQFGEVYLRIEPLEADSPNTKDNGGDGLEFVNDIFGGAIPGQFIPAIEKGVRMVMEQGAIAGCPMQDIRCSVYDGKHHPVDSKEVAFVTAAKNAFKLAVQAAKPVLLEPIVMVDVTVPNANMGDITGDLAGKRGRVQGTDMLPGDMCSIKALVPLSEMMTYQNQLKSVTGGQGSFSMELNSYEPVPSNVQQQIVAQYKPREEED